MGEPRRRPASRGPPVIQIVSQYVKDLSFENPSMGVNIRQPQIDFTVDLQARRVSETGPFEVLLKLRVNAVQEEKTLFLLEIAYGGLFVLDKIPEEALQPVLLIEVSAPDVPVRAPDHRRSRQRRRPAAVDDRADRLRSALSEQDAGRRHALARSARR